MKTHKLMIAFGLTVAIASSAFGEEAAAPKGLDNAIQNTEGGPGAVNGMLERNRERVQQHREENVQQKALKMKRKMERKREHLEQRLEKKENRMRDGKQRMMRRMQRNGN